MNNAKVDNKISLGFICLSLYLFLVYVRPYELAGLHFLIPLQPTRIFMILTLIFSFLNREWTKDVFKNSSVKWFLLVQLMALLVIPFSVWKAQSVDAFKVTNVRIIITFFVLLVFLGSAYRVRLVNRVVFLSFVCVAVRVFLAYKSGNYIIDSGGVRRVIGIGTLGSDDPNDMALVLAMALPIGLYFWHARSGLKKWAAGFAIAVLLAGLMVTGSRGGYLGAAAGLIVFYGFLYRKKKLKYIAVIIFLALAATLVTPAQYRARFLSTFDESDYSQTDERHGRVAVWKRSWKAMWKRPVGYGLKNSSIAEGHEKGEQNVSGKWMVIHNSYLQMGLEIGVVGLFFYLMFLWSGFANVKKILGLCRGPDDRNYEVLSCALAGGLGAFLVSSFFLSQAYNWNLYIFIALTVGLRRVVEEQAPSVPEPQGNHKLGNRATGEQGNQKKWKSRAVVGQLKKVKSEE